VLDTSLAVTLIQPERAAAMGRRARAARMVGVLVRAGLEGLAPLCHGSPWMLENRFADHVPIPAI
jgi:hypothetical protein